MRSGKPQTTASSRNRSGCHSGNNLIVGLTSSRRKIDEQDSDFQKFKHQALSLVLHSTAASGISTCLQANAVSCLLAEQVSVTVWYKSSIRH